MTVQQVTTTVSDKPTAIQVQLLVQVNHACCDLFFCKKTVENKKGI